MHFSWHRDEKSGTKIELCKFLPCKNCETIKYKMITPNYNHIRNGNVQFPQNAELHAKSFTALHVRTATVSGRNQTPTRETNVWTHSSVEKPASYRDTADNSQNQIIPKKAWNSILLSGEKIIAMQNWYCPWLPPHATSTFLRQ